MRCLKCGAYIKRGDIACPKCGTPTKIVSDYSRIDGEIIEDSLDFLDDDYDLDSFENDSMELDLDDSYTGYEDDQNIIEKAKKKRAQVDSNIKNKKIKRYSWLIALIMVLLLAAIAFFVFTSYSYNYQMYKANKELQNNNYDEAIVHYEKARKLDDESDEPLIGKAKAYIGKNEKDKAYDSLKEAIVLNKESAEGYLELSKLYESDNELDKITELFENVTSDKVKEVCKDYYVAKPAFNVKGGKFNEVLVINISSDNQVYYTLNDTTPSETSTKYEKEIALFENGTTVVSAVAINSRGIKSLVAKEKYEITVDSVPLPIVAPKTGKYTVDDSTPFNIEISGIPSGFTAYYTLDGKTPDKNSESYKNTIVLRKSDILKLGNPKDDIVVHVSVIFIEDKTGRPSSVVTKEYEFSVDK